MEEFGFTDDKRRELLKHFVTPELRSLARGILQPSQTAATTIPKLNTTTTTKTRAQLYRQHRAHRDLPPHPTPRMSQRRPQKQRVSSSAPTTTITTTTSTTTSSHTSHTSPTSPTSPYTPTSPTPPSPTPDDSFRLEADELHHFQRVQREHENLLHIGKWDGLWHVPRRRIRRTTATATATAESTVPRTPHNKTNLNTRPCLANTRRYAYNLLLGRSVHADVVPVVSDTASKSTTTTTTTTMTSLAAGVRATQRQHSYGSLAAQRVMMDATRLHNAALDNSFLAKMLQDDGVSGAASTKYVRDRASRARSERLSFTSKTKMEETENEKTQVLDDADFGVGDLDMTALGKATSATISEDLMSGFDDEESVEEELGNDHVPAAPVSVQLVQPFAPPSAVLVHVLPSSPRMATISLSSAPASTSTTTGMVFNSEKMCWETADATAQQDEDDMMAGFSSDENEDDIVDNDVMVVGTGIVPVPAVDADNFMAGFDDDSEDDDWGE